MNTPKEELRYWLALLRAPRVGPMTVRTLLDHFATPRAIFKADRAQLKAQGLSPKIIDYINAPDWGSVEHDLAWCAQEQAHILVWGDKDYPTSLLQIPDPPPVLYVYGQLATLNSPQLAIVGSRSPTPTGCETTFEFARHLANMGLTITSGMALGIDAASHEGALAATGMTIAVAGTGLDRVYPARHRELAHRIGEQGALISEFPLGTPPLARNFPRRNRIISGLSQGVLVVEAALRSGSLITARQALEQGREVFAVPGSIHNPQARGCNALIRQGAKLVETVDDILEELVGFETNHVQSGQMGTTDNGFKLDAEYQTVLESVGFEPTPVDTVVERSGLTAEEVCSMLLMLELQGYIATTSGGHYCQTG